MPWWATVLTSIGSAIIGGIFTFIIERRKLKFEEQKYLFELENKVKENKPRLEKSSFKSFTNFSDNNFGESDCNLIALGILDFKEINNRATFYYDEKALDNKNLIYVEYEFVNSGKTEIEDICLASNLPQSMSIFEMESKDLSIREKFLNYDVWVNKRYIKQNESFKLRVYYIKDQIPTTNFRSPELVVWLRDINGRYWSQILNSPTSEIEISRLRTYKEFKEAIDIKEAIECFRNPMLW